MPDTHIAPKHRRAFQALMSGEYENFTLFGCTVDDEPAAAVMAATGDGDEGFIHPLFVSVTEGIGLAGHEGRKA